ncbi:MAG: hypothetical protein RIR66_152 [Actinomycetota bacterium]|jgi:uncharacterized protein with FMN-binding domain
MKRSTLVALSTVAGVAGVLGFNPKGVDTRNMSMTSMDPTASTTATTDVEATPQATTQAVITTQSAAPTPEQTTSAASGTITGKTVQTRWGPVQLSVTVSNGQITAIDALQYPSGDGRSLQISRYSIPVLTQEALSAQSANIQGVGGATYTTRGYQQSLQSILDQM